MPSRRLGDYAAAAIVAVLAFVVSPSGIEFATGRADLSFRVTALSIVFVVFLLAVADRRYLPRNRLTAAWVFEIAGKSW